MASHSGVQGTREPVIFQGPSAAGEVVLGAGDVFPAACLAPLQLAWSSSCVAHSSDVTAGETVTSGGGYSGLLPTGSLHGLLCYSEHLSANPDPHCGLDPHLGASGATPSPSGMPRGLGSGFPSRARSFCETLSRCVLLGHSSLLGLHSSPEGE